MWTRGFIFFCRQPAAGEESLGPFPLDPDPKQNLALCCSLDPGATFSHISHLWTTKHGETPAVFSLQCLLASDDGDIPCEASWSCRKNFLSFSPKVHFLFYPSSSVTSSTVTSDTPELCMGHSEAVSGPPCGPQAAKWVVQLWNIYIRWTDDAT